MDRRFGEALLRLPAEPLVALGILRLLGDPHASTAELGRLVETDPVISARVLRVANSPFVGLRAPVSSAARAVVLLGFTQVRGIAAAAACGLLNGEVSLGPEGLWTHSLGTAAAASVAARWVDAPQAEAFTAGLLHGLGVAILHGIDRAAWEEAVAAGPAAGPAVERRHFGADHAEAGGTALAWWRLPEDVVGAVRDHHRPLTAVAPLTQAVILGKAAAQSLAPAPPSCPAPALADALADLGLEDDGAFAREVGEEVDALADVIEAAV